MDDESRSNSEIMSSSSDENKERKEINVKTKRKTIRSKNKLNSRSGSNQTIVENGEIHFEKSHTLSEVGSFLEFFFFFFFV